MPLTFSVVRRDVLGNVRQNIVDVTFDNSYVTGGEVYTANDFGLEYVDHIDPVAIGTRLIEPDYTNKKLIARDGAGAEIANATDLSAVVVRMKVTGR